MRNIYRIPRKIPKENLRNNQGIPGEYQRNTPGVPRGEYLRVYVHMQKHM